MLELHGNIWRTRCTGCGKVAIDHRAPLPEIPSRCPECGGLLRPDVVWLGESLPPGMLAATLENGAHLVEINPAKTPLSARAHEVIRAPATEALPRWWNDLNHSIRTTTWPSCHNPSRS